MTSSQENQVPENKSNDKEMNFRMLEAKYEKQLAQERAERQESERLAQQYQSGSNRDDEDDDSEPYVDKKKLNKTLQKYGQQIKQETQSEIQKAVGAALHEERKQNWMKNNSDFYEVMKHTEKFAQVNPDLAESILEMPDTFERQQLVYKNIKALGLHKPAVKEPSIQDKIDANRRSPYYQPSGVGSAPYASSSDFSQQGQKNAYEKMQELKNKLRI